MAYELIETIEVGSGGASSIEFTSIPQDGVDLVLKLSIRDGGSNQYRIQFNGDTGSNYPYKLLYGNGASVSNDSGTNGPYDFMTTSSDTANTFANTSVYISNYTSAAYKSFSLDSVTENNASTAYQAIQAATWNNTSAITSIKLSSVGAVQYSTASLYKIS